MLFTDETKVNLVGSDGKSYIRRFKGENSNSQFIKGQLQAGGGSILMWGAFCHDGIGPFVQIQNTFNLEKYIELLEETVKPFGKENRVWNFPRKKIFHRKIGHMEFSPQLGTNWQTLPIQWLQREITHTKRI